MDELDRHDGLGLGALVASGEVTAAELLDRAIARTEAVNGQINAVVMKHYDLARDQIAAGLPDGPFKGVPFLLKDLGAHLAGTITSEGSHAFADFVAPADATITHRAKAAGLVIFGKTATPEFGLTVSTESRLWGQTRSPWNLEHIAGGSSGGASAAVAARITPLAHASDGGGSIRIPAACCGLFGMKPSRGRVPYGPGQGIGWNGLSTQHAVTISVRDSAALLDSLAGADIGDSVVPPRPAETFLAAAETPPPSLRIAVIEAPPSGVPVHPDVSAGLADVAKLCESLGHVVEIARFPIDVAALGAGMGVSMGVDIARKVDQRAEALGRPLRPDELEEVTWRIVENGRAASARAYADARRAFDMAGAAYARLLDDYDVVLSPTLAKPPVKLGAVRLSQPIGDYMREVAAFSPYTAFHNQIGVPAMSVPLVWSPDGLPMGMMFAGAFGREDLLFSLAGQLEDARPWKDRRPPVCAA
jgi:Asp-tRNA(Asn)/Glu-tRNA(Gln) amidotransferase A subunit family amidase